jgi:urease accessory protein
MTMATITTMGTGTAMTTDPVSQTALYRLLAFLSPAFPVGAFTYSHGLEQVIEDGDVQDAQSLKAWLEEILRYGAGRSDAIILKETMLAATRGDEAAVQDLSDLGLALQPSKERHLESSAQGTAFVKAVREAWMPPGECRAATVFAGLVTSEDALEVWPYPVAVGLTAAAWKLPVEATVMSFLHAFSANIISAAVRAVPLGQNDGQRVLASLEPVISEITRQALAACCDDLGTSTFLADIASMAHETQYTRLFRS